VGLSQIFSHFFLRLKSLKSMVKTCIGLLAIPSINIDFYIRCICVVPPFHLTISFGLTLQKN
jgi:hypothetical protein